MKIQPEVAERGHDYYLQNKVVYYTLAVLTGAQSLKVQRLTSWNLNRQALYFTLFGKTLIQGRT